jgi:hypothetical protein
VVVVVVSLLAVLGACACLPGGGGGPTTTTTTSSTSTTVADVAVLSVSASTVPFTFVCSFGAGGCIVSANILVTNTGTAATSGPPVLATSSGAVGNDTCATLTSLAVGDSCGGSFSASSPGAPITGTVTATAGTVVGTLNYSFTS